MQSLDELIAPAYFQPFADAANGSVTELWLPGGRYSGKSTFIARCISALINARGNEQYHAVCFRRHQVDLRESVLTEIELALKALNVSYLWTVKQNPWRVIRRDTGQTITFNGLDDPRKHKSKKPPFGSVRWLWFEEMDEFDCWDDIESVQISYQRGGDLFQTFCSFNPPRSSSNWANAEAAHHVTGRKVYHTDYRDIAECGWIPDQILQRIEDKKRQNFEVYRHTYLGEVTGTGGEIFTNVKDVKLSDEEVAEMRKFATRGFDFGVVNDPTVLIEAYYDSDKDYLYIFDEWVKKHPYFTTIHEELKRRNLTNTEIIADTAPAGWIQNINMLGAKLRPCFKAEDWVETGVSWMRDRTKICIDSNRCPFAWDEFIHYEYETYANGKPKEKLPDRENHAIDACLRGSTLVEVFGKGNVPISELVGTNGILKAYDEFKERFVYTHFCNVRKTRSNAEIVRVELEDGRYVECTPDHRILTSNRGYVEAKDLTTEDILTDKARVFCVMNMNDREDVYDLEVPETHNFCVNGGVVVHNCRYSQEFNIKSMARKRFVGKPVAISRRY